MSGLIKKPEQLNEQPQLSDLEKVTIRSLNNLEK